MSGASDILFLTQRIPFPPDKGDRIRSYHVLRRLAERFRIHLGCFYDDPDDAKHIPELERLCASLLCIPLSRTPALLRGMVSLARGASLTEGYFSDKRLTRWVRRIVEEFRPESVFVYCSAMAPYAFQYRQARRILDMVDVDSEKFRAYAESSTGVMARLYAQEHRTLFALEKKAALAFDRSFFVSRAEADMFLRLAPECSGRVGSYDNGVDLDYFAPGHSFAPIAEGTLPIVFTGMMNYRPNAEAVAWFAHDVFPAIRERHPKAHFWIVGKHPGDAVRKLEALASVHVTGGVPDVRPYLAGAACVVAPLQIARGVQNKILEAMAMGKPVVATRDACEGISAIAGKELLIAKSADAFAESVIAVLEGKAEGMGARARARVEADYRWSNNLDVLDRAFDKPSPSGPAHAESGLGVMGLAS